jgi:hypothetical protein
MSQFAIDRENGVLLVKFAGPLTVESLITLDRELKSFIAREGIMPTVIDFTDITSVDVQTSTLIDRGKNRSLMPGQPRVFVATQSLLFGLLRVYGAHQDGSGERPPTIVRSLDAAFATLSLTHPNFEPIAIGSGQPVPPTRSQGIDRRGTDPK